MAYAAAHAPHQAPPEYLAKYRGRYDAGWDVVRADRHRRQIGLGIIPPDAPLPPHNPGVVPWDDVPPEQRRLFARMREAYAAMVDHTDAQLGRLVDFLERIGRLDDTIFVVMSDNGASPEGTPLGTLNPTAFQNRVPENLQDSLDRIDEIGGPRAQSNYPLGWAQVSNTPFRRYKQHTHEGGVRVPFVLSWPAGDVPGGGVRTQFQHSIDVTATVLDLVGSSRRRCAGASRRCRCTAAASATGCATRRRRRRGTASTSRCSATAASTTRAGRRSRSTSGAPPGTRTAGSCTGSTRTRPRAATWPPSIRRCCGVSSRVLDRGGPLRRAAAGRQGFAIRARVPRPARCGTGWTSPTCPACRRSPARRCRRR
ncbi:sulfatase-like hydrolase/transferase [Micromonospora sp. BRA006-A]|nr:sulfatase-like hydrolase/transferase [Micromonospora sp. BRA006-A]